MMHSDFGNPMDFMQKKFKVKTNQMKKAAEQAIAQAGVASDRRLQAELVDSKSGMLGGLLNNPLVLVGGGVLILGALWFMAKR